jgi:RHS repeat-associated protein
MPSSFNGRRYNGLHRHWMRDYDPTTWRYVEADSLGLVDGASVYGNVKGNPRGQNGPSEQYIQMGATVSWHVRHHGRAQVPPNEIFDEWLRLETNHQIWLRELPSNSRRLAQDRKDLRLSLSACLHSKSPRSSCLENSTFAASCFRGGIPTFMSSF